MIVTCSIIPKLQAAVLQISEATFKLSTVKTKHYISFLFSPQNEPLTVPKSD